MSKNTHVSRKSKQRYVELTSKYHILHNISSTIIIIHLLNAPHCSKSFKVSLSFPIN